MLNSIRKFSSTIFAKIFLFIIAIPFIFWGMGDVFRGGSQNTLVKIGKDKISSEKFIEFINELNISKNEISRMIKEEKFNQLVAEFVGRKLVLLESENLNINISDKSLSRIIKSDDNFKKDNKFSRNKYEKFLIKSRITAASFESQIADREKRKQLYDFIGGGIRSPKFLTNFEYNFHNQQRIVKMINLNEIYAKKINFSDDEIKKYYEKNKDSFYQTYRSVSYSNINPITLTGKEEFDDIFFRKLDQIEDAIAGENSLKQITDKFNLKIIDTPLFNSQGKNIDNNLLENINLQLVKDIFEMNESEPLILISKKNNYFLIELKKNEKIVRKIENASVKNEIHEKLKERLIIKQNSLIVGKLKSNKFFKKDFDQLAKKEHVEIKSLKINKIDDYSNLSKEFVARLYEIPKKKVALVSDNLFKENKLFYIEEIKNVSIDDKSDIYNKYFLQSNLKLISSIYASYDLFIQEKYNVEINYKTVDRIKNYFR